MKTLKVGQIVRLKVARPVYYVNAPMAAGSVGRIGVTDVACVRLRRNCKCKTFICVDFGAERVAAHTHEVEAV